MGGHVDFTVANSINTYQPVADKRIRVLAVFNPERDPNLPDVPTFAELYGEKYAYTAQIGLLAPPNTPGAILQILEEASAQAVNDPEFLANAENLFEVLPQSGTELEAIILNSYEVAEEFRSTLEMLNVE